MASAGFQIFRAPVRAASLTQPRSANWAIRRRYSKHEFVILAGYPALVIAVRDGHPTPSSKDRKSVVSGKRATVRVEIGGRSNIKKKQQTKQNTNDKSDHIQ